MGLTSLIKLRENKRDERRLRLAETEKKLFLQIVRLTELEESLAKNLDDRQKALSTVPLPIERIRLLQTRRNELVRLKSDVEIELARVKSEAEESRANLNEAVRDLRILENLKARKDAEAAEQIKKTERNS